MYGYYKCGLLDSRYSCWPNRIRFWQRLVMTITRAYYFPTEELANVLAAQNPIGPMAKERYAAISIQSKERPALIYPSWVRPTLALGFTDFVPHVKWTDKHARNAPNITLFDKLMARKVILFTHELLRAPENFTIFVNCSGGIARSAAIAKVIHTIAEVPGDPDGLRKSIATPNKLVLQICSEEYMKAFHGIVHDKRNLKSGLRG